MTTYRITWEIAVDSGQLEQDRYHDNVWGAAQWAAHEMREDYQWSFTVFDGGTLSEVDLSDVPEPRRGAASGYDRPSIT